ncbi:TetR/AcrR family transcriptional regulator [Postechiella marina]|uniref:TetR/AcrR family transcriptional regulator n=1 Tax=Postechiella marina TaxID=943941 RepID=A0ABP8CFX4_9FLAO
MTTKAALTSQHIIEISAPIFNKNGYAATSISDITKATGLTKGAIYGNFKNKEELAYAAFKYMVKSLISPLSNHLRESSSPIKKLYLITDFYRNYYPFSKQLGGCPILNIGVDANHSNSELLQRVREVIQRIQDQLCSIIENGIDAGEISTNINAMQYAKRIDTMIQGAIFMTHTLNDNYYMEDTMNLIDELIDLKLKI